MHELKFIKTLMGLYINPYVTIIVRNDKDEQRIANYLEFEYNLILNNGVYKCRNFTIDLRNISINNEHNMFVACNNDIVISYGKGLPRTILPELIPTLKPHSIFLNICPLMDVF